MRLRQRQSVPQGLVVAFVARITERGIRLAPYSTPTTSSRMQTSGKPPENSIDTILAQSP